MDCPKCHKFHAATDMIRTLGIQCPSCYFFVWNEEIEAIEKLFAPAMDAAVSIFENWRDGRLSEKKPSSVKTAIEAIQAVAINRSVPKVTTIQNLCSLQTLIKQYVASIDKGDSQ